MSIRRLAGAALALIGLWIAYGTIGAIAQYTSRGAALGPALADPAFLLPLLSSAGLIVGGLLAALGRAGGAWLSGIGAALAGLFTVAIAASGADAILWFGKAVTFGLAAAGFLVLALKRRA